jgi:hypothetical protein
MLGLRAIRLLVAATAATAALATAGGAGAVPVVISDTYQGRSASGGGGASQANDVIGAYRDFDIESITFTQIESYGITASIRFNYHSGDATLADWSFAGATMRPADLLFGVNGVHRYGVALVSHDGFDAGDLYRIDGTRTSDHYLSGSGLYWRFNNPVRMDPTGATHEGVGTVQTLNVLANGAVGTPTTGNPRSYEVQTTLHFNPSDDFMNDFMTNGSLSVHFASAICANDVIDGTIHAVPEAGSLLLVGIGLVGGSFAVRAIRARRRPAPVPVRSR